MGSAENVPAPSPAAAVLARRASREVKPMESGSDEDAEEPEEWEASSEEDEGVEEERVSNAQRGHECAASWSVISRPGGRRRPPQVSVWERRAGHAGPWWFVVWSRVAQLYSRQCLGARRTYGSGEEGAEDVSLAILLLE